MTRHPTDLFSLGAGLSFILLALGFMADLDINGAIVFPLLLVLLGLLGVVAAVRAQRANDEAVRSAASGGIPDDALQG
jgi:uncharacterized membrane protein YhaH (DUF805 family)